MAGMDVLCCDKIGTLTLNHLTVDKNLIEVENFNKNMWFPVDAGMFPEHKYEIVRIIQREGHLCGMTGNGMNALALKKADIGTANIARASTEEGRHRAHGARLRGTHAESACAICDETKACGF
ncbi:hypothetical protein OsJ_04881 [Oryza sativa Japonica Group]|nr:hypothetical protein OsJ_04881 [Oryza sativa Japonica Group]